MAETKAASKTKKPAAAKPVAAKAEPKPVKKVEEKVSAAKPKTQVKVPTDTFVS